MGRDKYGHYVNEKGVEIKQTTDKRGKDHIDVYDKCPAEHPDHGSIHIDFDSSTGKGTIVDTTNGSKESTDVKCFLTTACMRKLVDKFEDDCYELRVLRWFRDNFVTHEDIKHYYEIAPIIVASIEEEGKSEIVYDYIYENVVDACISAIENGEYEFAYQRYKSCILALEEQYARPKLENELVRTLKLKTNY